MSEQTAPKPILIELTPEQIELLRPHFDWVRTEHERGFTGILAAQVFAPGTTVIGSKGADWIRGQIDPTPARIRVGFLDAEKAPLLAKAAT